MSRFQRARCVVAMTVLAFAALGAAADETRTQYMAMFMDGKKVGHMKNVRAVAGGKVTTTTEMYMTVNRGGMPLSIHSTESAVETAEGRPISFKAVQALGIMAQTIEGVLRPDGRVALTSTVAGQPPQKQTIPWPKGALLPEGLRLLDIKKGLAKGTRYKASAFVPSMMSALDVEVTVGEAGEVDLLGRVVKLTEVRAEMIGPTGRITMVNYVDNEHIPQKVVTTILGMKVELVACSRQVATSPNDPLDFMDKTLVACPVSLPDIASDKCVTYHLASKDGKKLSVPATDNQTVQADGSRTVVTVAPVAAPAGVSLPYAGKDPKALGALKPTRFLQSDDEKVKALATKAVGDTTDAARAARKIEAFVAGYIRKKDLSVGYASASEVARSKQGDCTEHAVLVAAMCRAVGLPAEVVSGMVYVGSFDGRRNVFAPHAWNRVLIGEKWVGLDAAYGGYNAGHIALLTGNGDLDEFFGIISVMGNFTIEKVEVKK